MLHQTLFPAAFRRALFLLLLAGTGVSHAATVVYENAGLISGTPGQFGYENRILMLDEAGSYQAVLTDFEFPAAFRSLGLIISSSTEKMAEIWGSGEARFEAEPGKYFLGLVYQTDKNINLGMYGVNLGYLDTATSTVPLPASLWLLITGVMAIATYRRRS